jgi:hypothetical protein
MKEATEEDMDYNKNIIMVCPDYMWKYYYNYLKAVV